jgi:GntR family transcriptional regulator
MSTKLDAIATGFRDKITSGELRPGDRLPTVKELAEQHGVARATAQAVMDQLRVEGLIITQRGRPATVNDTRPLRVVRWDRYNRQNREDPGGTTTFEREVERSGWKGKVEYRHVGEVPCPAWAAAQLELTAGEPVIERARWRRAMPIGVDGQPDPVLERVVELFTSYIPAWVVELAPAVRTNGPCGVGGSYSRIERDGGLPLWRWRRTLDVRPSTPEETELLGVPRPMSVVEEDRVVLTTGGRPVTTDRCVTLADMIVFVDEFVFED